MTLFPFATPTTSYFTPLVTTYGGITTAPEIPELSLFESPVLLKVRTCAVLSVSSNEYFNP
jgi:hypothetical protein